MCISVPTPLKQGYLEGHLPGGGGSVELLDLLILGAESSTTKTSSTMSIYMTIRGANRSLVQFWNTVDLIIIL